MLTLEHNQIVIRNNMNNPFKRHGFDTLIGKGLVLRAATVLVPFGTTTMIDGEIFGPDVKMLAPSEPTNKLLDKFTGDNMSKTTLVVNGKVECVNNVEVYNIVITGEVKVDMIHCEGTLAIKAGAKVDANEIRYRNLVIEDGAIVLGKMAHLDYISAGEQT